MKVLPEIAVEEFFTVKINISSTKLSLAVNRHCVYFSSLCHLNIVNAQPCILTTGEYINYILFSIIQFPIIMTTCIHIKYLRAI